MQIRWRSLSDGVLCLLAVSVVIANDCYDKGTEEDFCLLGVRNWLEEEHKDEKH